MDADVIKAVFDGLARAWDAGGPLIGGVVGASITALFQRASDASKRRDAVAAEHRQALRSHYIEVLRLLGRLQRNFQTATILQILVTGSSDPTDDLIKHYGETIREWWSHEEELAQWTLVLGAVGDPRVGAAMAAFRLPMPIGGVERASLDGPPPTQEEVEAQGPKDLAHVKHHVEAIQRAIATALAADTESRESRRRFKASAGSPSLRRRSSAPPAPPAPDPAAPGSAPFAPVGP